MKTKPLAENIMTPLQEYLATGGLIRILTSFANLKNPSKVWIEKDNGGSYHIIEKEIIAIGKPPANAFEGSKIFLPSKGEVLKYLMETFHLSESQADEVAGQIGFEPPEIELE